MVSGNFYFINDSYYEKFKNCNLMENKATIDGVLAGRPCYYLFKENDVGIYWMVPVSSQVDKFTNEQQRAIEKYGICDGILFGYVRGNKNAFLVQNMCPVTDKYITNVYIDKSTGNPVIIPDRLKADINASVRKAIRMFREKGKKIILTNAFYIEDELLNEIKEEQNSKFPKCTSQFVNPLGNPNSKRNAASFRE